MHADILIRNGRLYDPVLGLDTVGDLVICGKKITALDSTESVIAEHTINAAGCLILPGLIDVHTHLDYFGTYIGMNTDLACIPTGVTAAVDCGSTGVSNVKSLLRDLAVCETKTKIVLNICAGGQIMSKQYAENVDPSVWNIPMFEQIFAEHKDKLIGLKMRTSCNIVKEFGMLPLQKTVELANHLNTRVYVHSTNPPCTMAELSSMLRSGDVVCHTYHGEGNTILADGAIDKGIWAARERGVVFDVSQGQGNFSIPVARQAMEEGFYPDTISTDLNAENWNHPLVFSLLMTTSKLLAMGLPLDKAVTAITAAPAELMGMAGELGTLKVGTCADVTIVQPTAHHMVFRDKYANELPAEQILLPMATIIDGQIQYRSPLTL